MTRLFGDSIYKIKKYYPKGKQESAEYYDKAD